MIISNVSKNRERSGTIKMTLFYCASGEIVPLEEIKREDFLHWYPKEEKWEVFCRLRADWIMRNGSLDEFEIANGRIITFTRKMNWAFKFIDERWPKKKKPSKLISWFKNFF